MSKGSVVSFDFDGTLHIDVRGTNPYDFDDPRPTPNEPVIKKLFEESKKHRIVIVTHRDEWMLEAVYGFVKWQKLPVDKADIYSTRGSKVQVLESIGAIRHYDDSPHVIDDFHANDVADIELIVVRGATMLKSKPPHSIDPHDEGDLPENFISEIARGMM